MSGGWTAFEELSRQAIMVFSEATNGLVGVDYEPLFVKSQVVAGTNYKFLCKARTITQTPEVFIALVSVFKPLDGAARLTPIPPATEAIQRLDDII